MSHLVIKTMSHFGTCAKNISHLVAYAETMSHPVTCAETTSHPVTCAETMSRERCQAKNCVQICCFGALLALHKDCRDSADIFSSKCQNLSLCNSTNLHLCIRLPRLRLFHRISLPS